MEEKIRTQVWKIREQIQRFEHLKDTIISFLEQQIENNLDSQTCNLWISDIKEAYYNVVAGWQMLYSAVEDKKDKLKTAKGFIYASKSYVARVKSELEFFHNENADILIDKMKDIFDVIWNSFNLVFGKLITLRKNRSTLSKDHDISKNSPLTKISDSEYHLPCSKCGQIAIIFKQGEWEFADGQVLIFRGITHEMGIQLGFSNMIFRLLEAYKLATLHEFFKKHIVYEGIDAYCPECDKIYCYEHYNPREVYDEGFYDCTYGTCPEGHERIIDD